MAGEKKRASMLSPDDANRVLVLSFEHSLDDLAMLIVGERRKQKIADAWVVGSAILALGAVVFFIWFMVIGAFHPIALSVGLIAALLLPLPAMRISHSIRRQRRVIVMAYLLQKLREEESLHR